jgi:hypothetical protein
VTRRYLAFDLETAKILPEDAGDLLSHRPLGIACAAALRSDDPEPILWHGGPADAPAPRLSRDDCRRLVADLEEKVREGYTLLTWNGLGFDFDILAEEADALEACARLARAHVDMMFHVHCDRGFGVALRNAASGLGVPGKTEGMDGSRAPVLWAEGRFREVLAYNVQDVRTALHVALAAEREGAFRWTTKKGTVKGFPLPSGWLDVRAAQRLPLPDTSWMSDPRPRERMTAWLPADAPV